jgi:hypothetical protein
MGNTFLFRMYIDVAAICAEYLCATELSAIGIIELTLLRSSRIFSEGF